MCGRLADRSKAATLPILCNAYRLVAWRDHWWFGLSPAAAIGNALHFYSGWCSEPRFSVSS